MEKLVKFNPHSRSGSLFPDEELTIEEYVKYIREIEEEYLETLKSSGEEVQKMTVRHEWYREGDEIYLVAYRHHTQKELDALEKKRKANNLRKLKATHKQKETRLKQYNRLKKEFG